MTPATDPRPVDRGWTTVRHFAYSQRSYADAAGLLVHRPAVVVVGEPSAEAPISPLHAHLGRIGLTRSARLHLGPVSCDQAGARLPLRWEDWDRPKLFPVLEGILSLAPVPGGRGSVTQVGLVGRYRPPLGALGGLADRVAGEDIAVEAVAGFVEDVAGRLERLLPAPDLSEEKGAGETRPGVSRVLIPLDHLADQRGGAVALGRQLAARPGVVGSHVNPISGLATIEYLPAEVTLADLLEELGVD